ncbi:hypothetical protein OsJ_00809 [Oryza sativa Japonica Group]|uniref:Uncharacterized protein n=1 Tax=Oryza sativa subsp. japonica TaxID=39947 RepID=A2ZQG9_ORYSJ|nr:hypothetical protein OsJ_00809 [Oryza sativa Japonica Group]
MDTASLCTVEKRGAVHVITLTGAGEHRLGPPLLSALRSAVAAVRAAAAAGSGGALVIARRGQVLLQRVRPGLGAHRARRAARLHGRRLPGPRRRPPRSPGAHRRRRHRPRRAAGCALALAHDAVVMRASRGFLYMSEVDAGLKIVDFFAELIRQKVPDAVNRRDLVLRGDKMTAADALRRGIVDAAVDGGVDDVVAAAVREAEALAARGWDGEIVAETRKAIWPELWAKVKDHATDEPPPPPPRPLL